MVNAGMLAEAEIAFDGPGIYLAAQLTSSLA